MSVTSGFFNSTNRDRLYNATDFGRFFEGIVTDGVLKDFEDGLEVTNLSILGFQVKPGKAWFNGIWIINDDYLIFNANAPTVADAYALFAVVVEANYTTREGSIKLVSTPAIQPSTSLADGIQNVLKPLLRNDASRYSGIHQYVLAVASKNAATTTFSTFAFLTGQTPVSSSPYYSIKDFIAPYAKAISYDGTIPDPFNYTDATNKPSINGVTLAGNKTTEDLGITANGSIFLGAATKTQGSMASEVVLTYSNVGTLPSGNPKKIILYGTNTSVYGFSIELVRSGTWYYPVRVGKAMSDATVPYISPGNNTTFSQSGASVTITVTLSNVTSLNTIFETELVW